MRMINPYTNYRDSDFVLLGSSREQVWEEGRVAGHIEKDAGARDVIEAAQEARDFIHYTLCTVPSCTCPEKDELAANLETAIAKATEGEVKD